MCWLSKKRTQNDIVNFLQNQVDNLQKDLEENIKNNQNLKDTNLALTNTIQEHKSTIENQTDQYAHLATDIKDKEEYIEKLNHQYKADLDRLKTQIIESTPSNTVVFYFTGYNYSPQANTLYYNIQNTLKNKISDIYIKWDKSMYDTLQMVKMNKRLLKIRLSKRIIKASYEAIFEQLNFGKKVVLIGENYGGSVINRIIDQCVQQVPDTFNAEILDNLYCYTFGAYYNPIRTDIPKHLQRFINPTHISNYIYKDDIVTRYNVGTPPPNLEDTGWTSDESRLTLWSISSKTDPLDIHYSYDILNIVNNDLHNKK